MGPPYDRAAQRLTIERALDLAAQSRKPEIVISDLTWPGDPGWKTIYNRVDDDNREKLRQMGVELRARRAADKAQGLTR